MPKYLPLFFFAAFLSVSQSYGQGNASIKLTLSPSMVVNESGYGDATLLVDEQGLAGDPLNEAGGDPETLWTPGWGDLQYNASAYIDLGQAYDLSHVFLYDFTGISNFTVEAGEPGNWSPLFMDSLVGYKTWKKHEVSVTTRYLRVTRQDGGANMNEIVLYRRATVNHSPELAGIGDQAVAEGEQLTIDLSASDADGDSLAFSVTSGPAFVNLTALGGSTAGLNIAPGHPSAGEYEVVVAVSDGKGGADSISFALTVNAANSGEPIKLALSPSMVVNESGYGDATLLVDEQGLAGDPLNGAGGDPETLWMPGWGDLQYNASAHIDLGQAYDLSHVFLYDFTGISDFTVEAGEPGNWSPLFTDDLVGYKTWKKHEVSVRTRYLRVTRQDGGANVNEIVLYGRAVDTAQEIVLLPPANLVQNRPNDEVGP